MVRTAVVLIVLFAAASSAQQPPAVFKQICPPCNAVSIAQNGLDDIADGALRDKFWALGDKGINQEPWQKAQGDRFVGTGATIVQIDTGVTKHPLLRPVGDDGGGIDLESGRDFFSPGHTNDDPLLSGMLRFPGHGTKTSSTIIARRIDQFEYVRGAAPGARLIPIRATQGVMLFPRQFGELDAQTDKVVKVLLKAPKGLKGHKIDVVSMSLGTWPASGNICDAVKTATDQGVIVIAAAGNEVRRTKYPARCETSIAVGGSSFDQDPWEGSAGSSEVAVSAPAEGVWTAAVVGGQFCMDASSGTSFATALVAAIAAEWVAFHRLRGIPLPPNHVEVFRQDLKAAARPWKNRGWSGRYGVGIADMSNVMRRLEDRHGKNAF